ncbi:MAG: gamma-glutamyl-gamma-aminobutyrate hydrolase family protein [Candidatus Woesearchaeota archaeon]
MFKQNLTFGIYGAPFESFFGISLPYIHFINKFKYFNEGNLELINPFGNFERYLEQVDILIVPGGNDVNPHRYLKNDEKIDINVGKPNVFYEDLDLKFLSKWLKLGKPTLGICRGMQTINVLLGGTLYQHIEGHKQTEERNITRYETKVLNIDNRIEYIKINSFHHQSIKDLAEELEIIAWGRTYVGCPSLDDKNKLETEWEVKTGKNSYKTEKYPVIIEGFKHKTLPIIGVQWHPEEFNCKFTLSYINKFIEDYANS